jgi:hypothetical protein
MKTRALDDAPASLIEAVTGVTAGLLEIAGALRQIAETMVDLADRPAS